MDFKKAIAKILNLKTLLIRSKNTRNNWVYKLSIRQVSLIFESGDLSCFGFLFRKRKFDSFKVEYDKYFNVNTDKQFNSDVFLLKLKNKAFNILPALYSDLMTVCSDEAKQTYLEYFGNEFKDISQLEPILKKINFLKEKISSIPDTAISKDKGLSFADVVILIESSINRYIDREMKLYEFKKIYDIELKKWQAH